jgi:hypothetical protein
MKSILSRLSRKSNKPIHENNPNNKIGENIQTPPLQEMLKKKTLPETHSSDTWDSESCDSTSDLSLHFIESSIDSHEETDSNNTKLSYESDLLILSIAEFIHDLMTSSCTINNSEEVTNFFIGNTIPKISMIHYIGRVAKYINRKNQESEYCTRNSSGFLALCGGLVIMQRLQQTVGVQLNSWTIHRIFLASTLIAHKWYEDNCGSNNYFSLVGGISLADMNKLEAKICTCLHFTLHIDEDVKILQQKLLISSS